MKKQLRTQVSDYDCVPATFINAIIFLFNQKDIPPLVVQRIYLYSLDSVNLRGEVGRGTSCSAVQLLGEWLNSYKYKEFRVSAIFMEGAEVNLKARGSITNAIHRGSVALLRVTKRTGSLAHYILGIGIQGDQLLCYDPSPMRKAKGGFSYVEGIMHSHNMIIQLSWLESRTSSRNFSLGPMSDRECLLLCRA